MRAMDLEARVISAVDRIRTGQSAERDLIECKRDWPQDKKARQLAGSLNRAGGGPVICIIGIDEETAGVHDISGTDVADWWNQITPKFDQMPPEMIRHILVPVGESGEQVMAVAFASDRAPYMVKTGIANPSLEVPMREGTTTRSTRRDVLLRLLIPTITGPPVVVLKAELYIEHHPAVPEKWRPDGALMAGQDEYVHVVGSLRVYFEHNGKDLVTLPAHGMRGRLLVDGFCYGLKVTPARELTNYGGSTNLTRAAPRDGVALTGPKAVSFDIEVPDLGADDLLTFEVANTVSYEIELDVLHASKALRADVTLARKPDDSEADNLNAEYQLSLASGPLVIPVWATDG